MLFEVFPTVLDCIDPDISKTADRCFKHNRSMASADLGALMDKKNYQKFG